MKRIITAVAAIGLLAGTASALPLNANRPVNLPVAPGGGSGETTVQQVLDAHFAKSGGGSALNAVTDQSNVGVWQQSDAGSSSAWLVSLLTAATGKLYVYSYATGEAYELLNSSGAPASVTFAIDVPTGALAINNAPVDNTFGNAFGFLWSSTYNNAPLGNSYTEDSKNGANGYGPDLNILALTYLVKDGTLVSGIPFANGTARNDDDWVIAFEDYPSTLQSNGTHGDGDFNDAIFFVKDINPVPEPATMVLLGSGLLGLAGLSRRRKK